MNNVSKLYLDEICDISSSKRIFAKEYVSCGVPFLRSKEVIELAQGKTISETLYISKDRYEKIKSKFDVPKRGDILLASIGANLGISYYINHDKEFYFKDGNVTWFKKFNDNVNPKYFYYWLNTKGAQETLSNIAIGSAQPALTIEGLKKLQIKIPDLNYQNRCVEILDAISNKIALNNKLSENLEELLLAIYKRIFIEDYDSQISNTCKAEEYFDISIGKTPPRKEQEWFTTENGNVTWVSISDMGSCGVYISNSSEYLTQQAVDKFNVKIVPDNTVILSFKLTVGRIAITDGVATTNEAIAHFKTLNNKIVEYLYCYLKNFNFKSMGSTSSIATAVNSKIIKSMEFIIPDEEKLEEFHLIAREIMYKIKSNIRESKKLIKLRDILLPKLMSGEIDLDNFDCL